MAAYTTIDNPELYFQTKLYTGNFTDNTAITLDGSEDMQPDLVWLKERAEAEGHRLHDSARGATKYIQTSSANAEATNADTLKSFNSDGFTLGANNEHNQSSMTYVAFCWKAGTTSGITTNGDTDVTPSAYSFNQTSGFSIVKWSSAAGQTAHGLGKKPQFIFTKRTDSAGSWKTYHEVLDATDFIKINDTAATEDNDTVWGDTEPDTVNFTVGSAFGSSDDYVGYCFTSIQGYSKFGSYTGNVNADGVFIYLGFKPALFIVKETGNAEPWVMYDNKRGDYGNANPNDQHLVANGTATESSGTAIDFLSNGVKLRSNAGHLNEGNYIYMAWAEAPFVNSNGVPCTAY